MAWKVYGIMPIDFGWEMLSSVEQAAAQIARTAAAEMVSGYGEPGAVERFLKSFQEARKLAVQVGWEGDFRQEPKVFWIPDENAFAYGFVWKQDNNGETFVVSPQPMPWLDALV